MSRRGKRHEPTAVHQGLAGWALARAAVVGGNLAAEGNTLAVSVQYSITALDVLLLNVANGRVKARFNLPDGYLAFASPTRLVLSTPEALLEGRQGTFPLGPQLSLAGALYSRTGDSTPPYVLALYSTRGRKLAELGASEDLPLVSGMHIVTDTGAYSEEQETLVVQSIDGDAATPIVGLQSPRPLAGHARLPLAGARGREEYQRGARAQRRQLPGGVLRSCKPAVPRGLRSRAHRTIRRGPCKLPV
jgi:hypothetical protein